MPVWIWGLAQAAGTAALGLATSLVTEAFLKKAIIIILERVVARTESDIDDQLLAHAKQVWNAPEEN